MGNQPSSSKKPNIHKSIVENKSKKIKFASCKMQGWRAYMVNKKH